MHDFVCSKFYILRMLLLTRRLLFLPQERIVDSRLRDVGYIGNRKVIILNAGLTSFSG